MVAAMDGCLYAMPLFADRFLRIDPFAGTVSTVGEAVPAPGSRCYGVVDRDDAIWLLPMSPSACMVRLAPRRPQTPLLTTLLQPKHHAVLQERLSDQRCYGPALLAAMWREAVRAGGDRALVCGLLEAVAPVLPAVVKESIEKNNDITAGMLLRTIVTVLPPQVGHLVFMA